MTVNASRSAEPIAMNLRVDDTTGPVSDESRFEARDGEVVLAEFRPDLDEHRRYRETLVVLTPSRVCFRTDRGWMSLERSPGLRVERTEHGGIGDLRIVDGSVCRARFRHTLARAVDAARFAAVFDGAEPSRDEPEAAAATDDSIPVGAGLRSLWRLSAFARARWRAVLLGAVLSVASTAVALIPPYLTMPLVDSVLVPGQAAAPGVTFAPAYHRVAFYLAGLAVAAVLAWALAWAEGAVLSRVSEQVSADLRNRTFSHLQRLSLSYFSGKRTGDLIARISSDTDRICNFLSDTLLDFIADVLMIVGTAIMLFKLDVALATAAMLSFPPIALLILFERERLSRGFLRGGRAWSAMTNILADTIPGVRVVKAFSQERREVRRFERANETIVNVNNRVNALWTRFWPLVVLLDQVGLLVVWAVGAWEVLEHHVTVGMLTAFIAYVGRFYARVESMSRVLNLTQRASASSQRLFEILDRTPTVLEPTEPLSLTSVEGEIRFDKVSFRYGSRLVLDGVSITVRPGQMVGIVGHTGSGKSTVANLICRFYDASDGAVLLDGVDIRRYSVEDYRSHIGIVLQDPFLFFGTIADNVAYGCPTAERSRILDAARAARAHEFVLKLPEAYDSMVGEHGQSLSGGERQRIAIARAILVNPKILILDEATSAVDVRTEREIQQALDNVVQGRTTVAIAHRLSTLHAADHLLVFKDGRVIESGSHGELLAKNGEYATLYRMQMARPDASFEDVAPDVRAASIAPPAPLGLDRIDLSWTADERLCTRDGLELVARRCFPLSDPERHVVLCDLQGRERAHIETPADLDAASRGALASALSASEFLPVVRRVDSVREEPTCSEWWVETDHGATRFVVDAEEHVRALPDGRTLITDSHGMRYLVPATSELDARSSRLVARFS